MGRVRARRTLPGSLATRRSTRAADWLGGSDWSRASGPSLTSLARPPRPSSSPVSPSYSYVCPSCRSAWKHSTPSSSDDPPLDWPIVAAAVLPLLLVIVALAAKSTMAMAVWRTMSLLRPSGKGLARSARATCCTISSTLATHGSLSRSLHAV